MPHYAFKGKSVPELSRPSKKQHELLSFIEGFIAEHGYGPSYREIMRSLDYKSVSTVSVHINGLIARGHLQKKDNSARSLEVIGVSTPKVVGPHVKPGDEKWLVGLIETRFAEYEKAPTAKIYDDLCVLVGALHVLELKEASASFKSRLVSLAKQG
jgi:hypothetical protein